MHITLLLAQCANPEDKRNNHNHAQRTNTAELVGGKIAGAMKKENKSHKKHDAKPMLPAVFFWLERHDWGKLEQVMYVEDFRAGIKNYEILRRECTLTGLTQYRRVYVKSCVHGLTDKLTAWWSSLNGR